MTKVTVIQRIVPHYRKPFFIRLAQELDSRGIELQLIYGQEVPGSMPQTISLDQPWAKRIQNRYIPFFGGHALWQPCLGYLRDSDLIISEHASSSICNYWLQFKNMFGGQPFAFWGQGVNVRAKNPNNFSERVKAGLIDKVDWWFAYTEHTVQILRKNGYPVERITVVENAVENEEFRMGIDATTDADIQALRHELDIKGDNIGLYCGALIPPKRIDFLLQLCRILKERIEDFHVIIIGGGPEQEKVEKAAHENQWIHYVGPKFAGERAPYFKLSRVMLQPGTVGLVGVDSFIAEVPLFTTDLSSHGPEITFIKHDINGYIAPDNMLAYIDAVCAYLKSPKQQSRLINGCRESAPRYTIKNMAKNFADGVESCLASLRAR